MLRFLKVFLAFFLLHSGIVFSQNRVDTLLNYLNDGGDSKHIMIFAHRGDWRNAPAENSLLAYQKCIDAGLDGIEVDLQMTKDSVLVIMHDETLDRTTTGTGPVSDYRYEDLKKFFLKSPIGVITRLNIPTFEEVLELSKDKILVQVDKWKPYYKEVTRLVKKHNCERQIVIRTTDPSKSFQERYGNIWDGFIVMPVLVCKGNDVDEIRYKDFVSNYATPAISFSFVSEDFEILNKMKETKSRGQRLWLNSLWNTFNAGHDEELAQTDLDNSYGWLIDQGANIIFSDNPMYLKQYLISVNRW